MARRPAPTAIADPRTQRRRGRRVTYTFVTVLLLAGLVHADAWPLSAYRLFSVSRTADGASLTLVAITAQGDRQTVPRPDGAVTVTTGHLYDDFARADAGTAREMARAWLELGGLDAADVTGVELERSTWHRDPDTGDRTITATEVVAEVGL